MTDFTHLDDAICTWLQQNSQGHPCNSNALQAVAAPLTNSDPWRLIDRRLQELRKSGRVQYTGRRRNHHGWVVHDHAGTTTP